MEIEKWEIWYHFDFYALFIILGLQSIPWESRDKDTAAMLVEQTIDTNDNLFDIECVLLGYLLYTEYL